MSNLESNNDLKIREKIDDSVMNLYYWKNNKWILINSRRGVGHNFIEQIINSKNGELLEKL